MEQNKQDIARACLKGAETGALAFPEIVQRLMREGFDGYAMDFRAGTATYYMADGATAAFAISPRAVAARFDGDTVKAAIREAQQNAPGYTYSGFCRKVTDAGCAGYLVSFPGRRVLYFGRTAETHVELFPR